MKRNIYLILVSLVILTSCKKEELRTNVFAGIYDTNFIYNEFNPAFQLKLKFDSILNIKYGIDSIDLNLDGDYDLFISQRFLLDTSATDYKKEKYYPYSKLTTRNGLQIAFRYDSFPMGFGTVGSAAWVYCAPFNTMINGIKYWSETEKDCYMWAIPYSGYVGSYGEWYNITNSEMYITFKMKMGKKIKFGWIKVNQVSRENMTFMSYAIEK
jgi:hypothetical protein